MSKSKWKELTLSILPVLARIGSKCRLGIRRDARLILPVAALIGLVLALPVNDGPPLVLEKTEVVRKPPDFGRKYYDKYEFDTQVNLFIRYNAPTLHKRFSVRPKVKIDNPSLVDDKGRNWLSGHEIMGSWSEDGQPLYKVTIGFALSQSPQSVGRITLKSKAVVDNKWMLLLSVVVRDKT